MENEITLSACWRVVVKWKRTIVLIVSSITIFSALISLCLPKIYKSEATIMPLGGQMSASVSMAALSQLGLSGLFGGGGGAGGSNSSITQLLVLLKSRTLAEKMIQKHDLVKVFYPKLWDARNQRWKVRSPKEMPHMEEVVRTFFTTLAFADDRKSQLLVVSAEMRDPEQVAWLVNGYVKELETHIKENTFTTAKRNRLFVERQLERNKAEFLESGKELSVFYAKNNISNIVPTADVDITLETRGRRDLKSDADEGQGQEQTSSSLADPAPFSLVPNAFADAEEKTRVLRKQADEIKDRINHAMIVKDVPQQVYLQYLTLRREILGQLNTSFTHQYEMAKIQEAKEDLSFQVLDWARVPMKRSKPKRRQIVKTAFIFSLLLSVFYVFLRENSAKIKKYL